MAKVMTEEQIVARRERIARRAGRPPTRVKVPQEVYVKQGKITGRPSLKTPAVIDEILAGVAAGRSLANVCKDNENLPDVRNVYRWMDQDDGFRLSYLRACANRSLVYADTIGDIASGTLAGRIDPNAARVAINAYQWVASKLSPGTYGERQEVTVNHQHLHLHALRQLSEAAKVGQDAIRQRELELRVMQGDMDAGDPPGSPDGRGAVAVAATPASTHHLTTASPASTHHLTTEPPAHTHRFTTAPSETYEALETSEASETVEASQTVHTRL